MIKRRQLFEFEDQWWIPDIIKDYLRDVVMHLTSEIYVSAVPKILEVLQKNNSHQILDLCSGAGGPAPLIHQILTNKCKYNLELTLSDKYVHKEGLSKYNRSENNIRYHSESVNIHEIPDNMNGTRTLFTSFHHFNEESAKMILLGAKEKNIPIAIFEFTERNLSSIIAMILSTIALLVITPTIKPFKFSRILFTYIIPIIPIIYYWDSVVSHLRSYTVKELKNMTNNLGDDNYVWEIGKINTSHKNRKITFLIGTPQN